MEELFTLTKDDIAIYSKEYLNLGEESLREVVWKNYSDIFQEGGLGGETPIDAIERWVNDTLLPSLRSARHKNIESTRKILDVLEDQNAEITSGVITLIATYLVDILELPEPNERKLIIALAALVLLVAKRAKRAE
jgi:hypothetical protein